MGGLPAAPPLPILDQMTQPLGRYFQTADAIARLSEHAARLTRLQAILVRALPPLLAESCAVANLKGEELVIHARSGAVAARLKQMLPSLVEAYARQGVLLAGVKIKVDVRNPAPLRPALPRRTVSAQARGSLAQLATTLPAGSPLAQALRRFVSRS
jgi:hypothetical protein